jgi:hypothetical protein
MQLLHNGMLLAATAENHAPDFRFAAAAQWHEVCGYCTLAWPAGGSWRVHVLLGHQTDASGSGHRATGCRVLVFWRVWLCDGPAKVTPTLGSKH